MQPKIIDFRTFICLMRSRIYDVAKTSREKVSEKTLKIRLLEKVPMSLEIKSWDLDNMRRKLSLKKN